MTDSYMSSYAGMTGRMDPIHIRMRVEDHNNGKPARLRYENLSYRTLAGLNMQGMNFEGAFMKRARVRDSNLRHADLRRTNLHHAQVTNVDLYCARLNEAVAEGAIFRDTDLTGARFAGADMTGAKFPGSLLHCTDFTGAILKEADLSGATVRCCHGLLDLGEQSSAERVYAVRHKDGMRILEGRRWLTLREAREWSRQSHLGGELAAMLDYAEALAAVRGWDDETTADGWYDRDSD